MTRFQNRRGWLICVQVYSTIGTIKCLFIFGIIGWNIEYLHIYNFEGKTISSDC